MTGEARRVAIVGGGIAGLSAALRLQESVAGNAPAPSVRLFEAAPRVGGQIRTERVAGLLVEGGPDSLVLQKPAGVALCKHLGLEDQLLALEPSRPAFQVVHEGRLVAVPDGFLMVAPSRLGPLLASPLFTWRGKLRIAAERLIPGKRGLGDEHDESLRDFVTRRLGDEVFDRVVEPIVGGLFTADADGLSLRMTLPGLLQLEREYGSVIKGLARKKRGAPGASRPASGFASLEGGMGSLVQRLVSRLHEASVTTGAPIEGLHHDGDTGVWKVRPRGRQTCEADAVILACPSFASAELLRELDGGLSRELDGSRYACCATVNLVYDRQQIRERLAGHGFFVPRTAGLPVLACSYVSHKFESRFPEGCVVLRAFMGGAQNPGVLEQDDEGLARAAHGALARLLQIDGAPVGRRVFRSPQSMPQYPVGHRTRLDRVERLLREHPGLFVCGSALGSVGLPDCIASGQSAAVQAAEYVASRSSDLRLAI